MCFPLEGWHGGLGCFRLVKILPRRCLDFWAKVFRCQLLNKSHHKSGKVEKIWSIFLIQSNNVKKSDFPTKIDVDPMSHLNWNLTGRFCNSAASAGDFVVRFPNPPALPKAGEAGNLKFCNSAASAGVKENVLIPWVPAGCHWVVGGWVGRGSFSNEETGVYHASESDQVGNTIWKCTTSQHYYYHAFSIKLCSCSVPLKTEGGSFFFQFWTSFTSFTLGRSLVSHSTCPFSY